MIYPKGYFDKVSDINVQYLIQNNIKGLILDVDNTLIDYERNINKETVEWVDEIKRNNIKLCILSNSEKEEKIKSVADKLKIPYMFFAMKPLKKGFKKAKKLLELNNNEIGVIGDQIFTDVIGANRMKMYSILVKPLDKKDIWITVIKRPIENVIIKRYLNKNGGGSNVF